MCRNSPFAANGELDIEMAGVGCAKLVNDMFEARQKLVTAFKRQQTAQVSPKAHSRVRFKGTAKAAATQH